MFEEEAEAAVDLGDVLGVYCGGRDVDLAAVVGDLRVETGEGGPEVVIEIGWQAIGWDWLRAGQETALQYVGDVIAGMEEGQGP